MVHTVTVGNVRYCLDDIHAAVVGNPTFRVAVRELATYLHDRSWDGCPPCEFLDRRHTVCCKDHENRIRAADLTCPLVFDRHHELLDGVHRVVCSIREGVTHLPAQIVIDLPQPRAGIPLATVLPPLDGIPSLLHALANSGAPKSLLVDVLGLGAGVKTVGRADFSGRPHLHRTVSAFESAGIQTHVHEDALLYFGSAVDTLIRACEIDNSELPHSFRLGGLLGYPCCCCVKAAELGESRLDRFAGEMAVECEESAVGRLISPTHYGEGRSLISHVPCSPECNSSLQIAERVREYMSVSTIRRAVVGITSW